MLKVVSTVPNEPTDDYEAALRYGIFTRRIRPLWFQGSFSGRPEDIIIAYGQARSVVFFLINTYGQDRMAALFPVLQRTLSIDQALMEVYGMDQYGVDSAWRESLGLDPLPSPDELASQLNEQSDDPQAEASEGDAEPAPEPTSVPEPSPEPEAAASGATGDDEQDSEGGSTSSGCNAPAALGSANAPTGVGMLLLLAAPLGLIVLPNLRRRWPFF